MQFLNFKQYLIIFILKYLIIYCWGNAKKTEMRCIWYCGNKLLHGYRLDKYMDKSQNSGKCLWFRMPALPGTEKVFFLFLALVLLFVPEYENDSRAGQTHFSYCCHVSKPCNLWFQINIFLSHVLFHFCPSGGTNGMIFTWSRNRNKIL